MFGPPLDLEILLHVLTDNFDLEVKSLSLFVDDKVCIVSTKVVEEQWDLEADWALQVTLAVGGANKAAVYVVSVTDFGTLRLAIHELVSADIAPCCVIKLLLLACIEPVHRSICPQILYNLRYLDNERV